MPRYRIPRNSSGENNESLRKELNNYCTEDEAIIYAPCVSNTKKEETDVVVANPALLPQPCNCNNWLPKFVYLNSDSQKKGKTSDQRPYGGQALNAELELQAKKKFICENLRDYYAPNEEGRYSVSYWTALEQLTGETNISEMLVEEIALEGLDGITLQALWERLMARLHKTEICPNTQKHLWEVIRSIPFIMFYQLSEPRPDLQPLYRENYVDERGNPFEPAWAPKEIYSYEPIVDKKKKTKGSCAMYRKRKCKSKYFTSRSYDEILRYSNTMVMVAPQHIRENVIFAEDHEEEFPLTVAQYCMMERIGRSRREGEQTKGNVSLTAMKLENKSSFHYRRDLLELGVITRQTYAMKFASTRTSSWISIFHLPRYFVPCETVPVKNVKRIILDLRMDPRHFQEYFNIQKKFGKPTMKFVTDPMISHILQIKEESQATLFPQLYETVKSESKKAIFRKRMIKVLCLTDIQVSEGEIDILLREIQENHVPKNERIVEEYDEDNDQDSDENVITEDETMLYKLFVYLHESGGLGVTLEEVAVHFAIGKLDSRTAIRAVQRKKCLSSYWEGKGKTKCRRYFLSKFGLVNRKLCAAAEAGTKTSSNLQLAVERLNKLEEQEFNEPENTNFVVMDIKALNLNFEVIDSYTNDESEVMIVEPQEKISEDVTETIIPETIIPETIVDRTVVENVNVKLRNAPEIVPQQEKGKTIENVEQKSLKSKVLNTDVAIPFPDNNVTGEALLSDMDTEEVEHPESNNKLNEVSTEQKVIEPPAAKGKKRRFPATDKSENEVSVTITPQKKRKPLYDDIDRAAIQKRKKQRVEWSAEEDHCILIIFVASVVFIPNYVLGKTFVFNAPQIRDLLHKNIRDSANKTQTAVRRRLHFLMKQRKFNARYRYYLSATFSDDRVFKFVERHINQFKRPGRGFLEISVSALSAVYTYIMTHFVGINAFNEEDEHFIDAPSFGQLTALRSYRRSEISEEFMNAEDDLTGDNAEAPNVDTIRQKEQKKEWSSIMCQMKARQIHSNPKDFLHIVDCVLSSYLALYDAEVWNNGTESDSDLEITDYSILSDDRGQISCIPLQSICEETEEIHSWRTDRKKTYWERNIVLGVNEPKTVSEILIWQIRSAIMRILLTSKHVESVKNYLSKVPEYYLDYIVYSMREMEIASHSKRARNVRLGMIANLFRGPYPNDYYMAQSLDSRCVPGEMILMDDRTRCGTFLCIIEWLMRNVAVFHFKYSDVVVGVKADWKDVFQLLVSEEFGFKVFMKKPQKRLQFLRNLIFDEDIEESERAECLKEFVYSVSLPPLSNDTEDDSRFSRLARLDNFRRKLEYLSKILAKFRRRKNKQVDWGVYLKRERDIMRAKLEGKPLNKAITYSGIPFDVSDDEGDSDDGSSRRINPSRKKVSSGDYTDDPDYKPGKHNSNDDDSECEDELSEEFNNAVKINFTELVSSKDSSPELKAVLNKINENLALTSTTIYYSDEINKVIDERLSSIKVEEEAIRDELQDENSKSDNPEKMNYRNKIHPTNYDEVEVLGNRLSSFSMANEFLTMEEPSVFVRKDVPQSESNVFTDFSEYDFSKFPPLYENCQEMKFVKYRLARMVREKDVDFIYGLREYLKEPIHVGKNELGEDDCSEKLEKLLGCYFELFRMIRITEEIGISLELLKTYFTREYLKDGLEILMAKKFIFLVGVHNRKFISVEFIDSWSIPVKLKNRKFLDLKSCRRYIVHPWVTSGGQVEWKLVIKLFTMVLSYMDTVSVAVDDLCRSLVPILSNVETLLLVECLVQLNVISAYKVQDCGTTTLWSKPSVSHYKSRLQEFDSFLDLEDLSVQLEAGYFKRFCDVQTLLKSMSSG